jgi:O-antigen ligase
LSFLLNMMFVVISRTALVTMPVMLVVFSLLNKWLARQPIALFDSRPIGLSSLDRNGSRIFS